MSIFLRSIMLVCMLLILLLWQAAADQLETYRYQQRTGSQVVFFDWQLFSGGESLHLKTRQQEEVTETTFNSDLSTQSWNIQNLQTRTDLAVNRTGDTLVMRGLFEGEDINREIRIDSAPWYQALSVSLRQFIAPDQATIEFWTIRPDTLDVHQLQVAREKNTLLEVGDDLVSTIQLKIQPVGWRAPFWNANYWLREKDGVFIRYQGRSGPPGAPLTRIVLIDQDFAAQISDYSLQPPPQQPDCPQ